MASQSVSEFSGFVAANQAENWGVWLDEEVSCTVIASVVHLSFAGMAIEIYLLWEILMQFLQNSYFGDLNVILDSGAAHPPK